MGAGSPVADRQWSAEGEKDVAGTASIKACFDRLEEVAVVVAMGWERREKREKMGSPGGSKVIGARIWLIELR
uniref:DUF834 domain-containing protein n=1 Tax=Oryza nivara TaxID=4536 RepID=A0A0E0HQL1_ORYNI